MSTTSTHAPHGAAAGKAASAGLTLAALGVVFGDIGTSPLYAMKEVFAGPHPMTPDPDRVHGIISLIFWALMIIVTVKYVMFIMRANNEGEGGIMALIALVKRSGRFRFSIPLVLLGMFGAALFYGDGMITPAVSVLSAVEGLSVTTPALDGFIVPIALVILTGLFLAQRFGTGAVGSLFGPVMLVWFTTIAVLGVVETAKHPGILRSLSPTYAVQFFMEDGTLAFLALGSVVLAVTGAEALYADMGHFGRGAIARAWLIVALPALLLNYMGQGALVLSEPGAIENPFYLLAPEALQLPLVILATMAAVIASQAVISGAFSVTRQAVRLGFLPRVLVKHTSGHHEGQIYIPSVNWILYVAIVGLVLGFQSSSNLASAYGIAVTATLAIDTVLAFVVVKRLWHRSMLLSIVGAALFLTVDLAFFAANVPKILHGGWFPLVIGVVVFTLLSTWWRGRQVALRALAARETPLSKFLRYLDDNPPLRVPGTAVYLTAVDAGTPMPLNRNLEHNHVLHRHVILLTSQTRPVPYLADDDRMAVEDLGHHIWRVVVQWGFQEQPDVPRAVRMAAERGVPMDPENISFFLSHVTLNPVQSPGMALWRKRLFAAMSKNSFRASTYLGVPSQNVVEVGTQVDI
jgi:KUP system potassium uptake protein